jgi:hypothetical protein
MKTMLKLVPVLVAAVAASGAYAKSGSAGSAGGDGATATQAAKPQAKEKKICASVDLESGTRIAKPKCRTKAEWEALGVDMKKR